MFILRFFLSHLWLNNLAAKGLHYSHYTGQCVLRNRTQLCWLCWSCWTTSSRKKLHSQDHFWVINISHFLQNHKCLLLREDWPEQQDDEANEPTSSDPAATCVPLWAALGTCPHRGCPDHSFPWDHGLKKVTQPGLAPAETWPTRGAGLGAASGSPRFPPGEAERIDLGSPSGLLGIQVLHWWMSQEQITDWGKFGCVWHYYISLPHTGTPRLRIGAGKDTWKLLNVFNVTSKSQCFTIPGQANASILLQSNMTGWMTKQCCLVRPQYFHVHIYIRA